MNIPLTVDRILQDGFAAHRAGRVGEAEIAYRAVLREQPFHFDARHLLGVTLRAQERRDEAAAELMLALAIQPDSADAHNNLANIHMDRGNEQAARTFLDRALHVRPAFFQALLGAAEVALRAVDRPRALDHFAKAAIVAPAPSWHFYCRGQAHRVRGDIAEATTAFAQAVGANPDHPGIHAHWGEILEVGSRLPEALNVYREGLARDPLSSACLEGIGRVLRGTFDLEQSVAALKSALCLNPSARGAALHLGAALFDLRRLTEARHWFSVARRLVPSDEVAFASCFNTALYACDWDGWQSLREEALAQMRAGKSSFQPFSMLATSGSPADQLLSGRAYSAYLFGAYPEPLWRQGTDYQHDPIRIGYLSADFHTHATAYLVAELIEVHDRNRFEIIAFSYGPDDGTPMRKRMVDAFDQFHDIRFKSDSEAAEIIRRAEIDILIDLKGYTQHARACILAYRPAPAQVNYLGYPGTLGSPFHDYVIADSVVIPPEDEHWFTETVIRLPGTYQVNDSQRIPAQTQSTRQAEGLPEDAFVFCCFNNNWKIGPDIFAVWMGLLRQVPGSVLWLIQDNDTAVANLRAAAARHGIDSDRLIFVRRVPLPEHLARHRLADLFLDTLPYGAHTTASDALLTGLPLLTCRGESFAGRVAASLLTTLGVEDLIVESLDDYAAAALKLVEDPTRLQDLRDRLLDAPNRKALFDARAFARGYEEALLSIHHRKAL